MNPSPACEALIKKYETCAKGRPDGSFGAYMPTPNDVPTIGWGSTGADIKMGTVWTQSQCDTRFTVALKSYAAAVWAAIAGAPTTQAQFDAMVSLAYNIGKQAFADSTLLRKHQAHDYDAVIGQFARWNKQGGKVLNGLTTRRAEEARMYKGLPA